MSSILLVRIVSATALLTALSGCGSAARTPAEQCAASGAAPGSPTYQRCVSDEETKRETAMRRVLNGIPVTGYGPTRF